MTTCLFFVLKGEVTYLNSPAVCGFFFGYGKKNSLYSEFPDPYPTFLFLFCVLKNGSGVVLPTPVGGRAFQIERMVKLIQQIL